MMKGPLMYQHNWCIEEVFVFSCSHIISFGSTLFSDFFLSSFLLSIIDYLIGKNNID